MKRSSPISDASMVQLKLVSSHDPWADSKDFLTEVVVSSFEKQQSQKEAINALPWYPNEQIMWDESVIHYSGEGCLALPKLNLQFLTLHDYFLGNPSASQWPNMPNLLETVDFKDTFLDANHLSENFPDYEVSFINVDGVEAPDPSPPFRITLPKTLNGIATLSGDKISEVNPTDNVKAEASLKAKLIVEAYTPPDLGPYSQDQPKQKSVRFTPTQVTENVNDFNTRASTYYSHRDRVCLAECL